MYSVGGCVNHSWIFPVPEKAELLEFILSVFANDLLQQYYTRRICWKIWRTILHGQRHQTRLSGEWFLIRNGILIITRNPAAPDFLQPVPCAYGDDFAVAASSFRLLMTALSPTFEVVDQTARLNLNHRKCCWEQYGSESCQSLTDERIHIRAG